MNRFLNFVLLVAFISLSGCVTSNDNKTELTHQERIEGSFEQHPDTETAKKMKELARAATQQEAVVEGDKITSVIEKCEQKKKDRLSSCSKSKMYCDAISDAVLRNCFASEGYRVEVRPDGAVDLQGIR